MTTQNTEDKENTDASTHNNQISELTQEVQNMGKALAAITEKTNNQIQHLNPLPTNPNMGQYPDSDISLQPPP